MAPRDGHLFAVSITNLQVGVVVHHVSRVTYDMREDLTMRRARPPPPSSRERCDLHGRAFLEHLHFEAWARRRRLLVLSEGRASRQLGTFLRVVRCDSHIEWQAAFFADPRE